jgi:hypothetical protein
MYSGTRTRAATTPKTVRRADGRGSVVVGPRRSQQPGIPKRGTPRVASQRTRSLRASRAGFSSLACLWDYRACEWPWERSVAMALRMAVPLSTCPRMPMPKVWAGCSGAIVAAGGRGSRSLPRRGGRGGAPHHPGNEVARVRSSRPFSVLASSATGPASQVGFDSPMLVLWNFCEIRISHWMRWDLNGKLNIRSTRLRSFFWIPCHHVNSDANAEFMGIRVMVKEIRSNWEPSPAVEELPRVLSEAEVFTLLLHTCKKRVLELVPNELYLYFADHA